MKTKISILLLISTIFLTSGFGCRYVSQEVKEKMKNVELNYWRVWDGPDVFNEIIAKYTQLHPFVKINYTKLRYEEFSSTFFIFSFTSWLTYLHPNPDVKNIVDINSNIDILVFIVIIKLLVNSINYYNILRSFTQGLIKNIKIYYLMIKILKSIKTLISQQANKKLYNT